MKHTGWSALATGTLLIAATLGSTATANAQNQTPVNGAVRTTVNLAADGDGHCLNGGQTVNCNIYTSKQYVWLSGQPMASSLSDGTYLFAVLVPGGQADPNDGTTSNL